MTDTRMAVLRCIATTGRPLTAKEVFEKLSKGRSKISIDLVSIYRILQTLEEHALVHQVLPNGGFFPCSTQTACAVTSSRKPSARKSAGRRSALPIDAPFATSM